jgi:hypothetical protein
VIPHRARNKAKPSCWHLKGNAMKLSRRTFLRLVPGVAARMGIRRQEFLGVMGGVAATWPVVARAQQPAMPVIE